MDNRRNPDCVFPAPIKNAIARDDDLAIGKFGNSGTIRPLSGNKASRSAAVITRSARASAARGESRAMKP